MSAIAGFAVPRRADAERAKQSRESERKAQAEVTLGAGARCCSC
jgi:hypothetical protein